MLDGNAKTAIDTAKLDKLLGKYSTVTDAPRVNFTDESLVAYPDANLVLTTRDPDFWIKSVENSFFRVLEWPAWRRLSHSHPRFLIYTNTLLLVLRDYSSGHWQDREALKHGFHKHYAHMRTVVPKGRLLEHRVGEGWVPLCEFLGKDIPDEPFPHINEGDYTHGLHLKVFWMQGLFLVLKILPYSSPIAAVAYGIWWYRGKT